MQIGTETIYAAGRTKKEALERLMKEIEQWKKDMRLYHYISHKTPVAVYDRAVKGWNAATLLQYVGETPDKTEARWAAEKEKDAGEDPRMFSVVFYLSESVYGALVAQASLHGISEDQYAQHLVEEGLEYGVEE